MNKKAILGLTFSLSIFLFAIQVSAYHYPSYPSYTTENSYTTTTTYSPYGYTTTTQRAVSNPPYYGSFQPNHSPSQFYGYGYYPPHYQYYRINQGYGSYGYVYPPQYYNNRFGDYWRYGNYYW